MIQRQMIPPCGCAPGVLPWLPAASRCSRVRPHTPVDRVGPAAAQACGRETAPAPGWEPEMQQGLKKKQNSFPRGCCCCTTSPSPLCGSSVDSGWKPEVVHRGQLQKPRLRCSAQGVFPRVPVPGAEGTSASCFHLGGPGQGRIAAVGASLQASI
nr:uncharacterized protein LOC119625089 [Chlorocebus sabaeus]